MSNVQGSSGMPAIQEFSIRVPKNVRKKYHMMRFNSVLNVDFSKWTQVKMERENNQKEFKGPDEESPKFGAGSEFGREAKEEARRKKYGIITKKYRAEDQPWILKVGGKTGKKFKGIREGGVGENAAYYVFTHASDGAIEAYPLCEWYNFQPIGRYKALSAEEAEQEFGRRNKAMNYFSLMLRKRLRNCEDGEMEEEDGKGKKPAGKSKELKISDMDDWVDSDDDDDSDEDDDQNEEAKEKKEKKDKKKKKEIEAAKKKKKKKAGSDDSAVEESDDGDEEGRELDYISDSSDSDSDHEAKVDKEMKGVAEESALRKLLASDEEDDEEEEEQEEKKSDNEDNPPAEEASTPSNAAKKKKKKKKIKKEEISVIKNEGESSSDFSPDSSDSEIEAKSKQLQQQTSTPQQANSGGSNGVPSTPVSGNDLKRVTTPVSSSAEPPLKKSRIDTPTPSLSGNSDSGITEEAVRRYLMRKPMTTTELLQKFKSRKTGLSSDQLVNVMTQILKKINPVKQTIKNKMYLSLK